MFRPLFKLALPMVVAQLAFASMSFIDTLLMGQLGVDVLAGGGLGAVVFQFFYVVGLGVLIATGNLIAFEKGQSQHDAIHSALLSGVVTTLVISFVFGLCIWYIEPLLLALGQDPAVVSIAMHYLKSVVWALLPAFGFILLRSLALGMGDASAILPVSVVAAALNYPISYVLMTGQFGLPAMGLTGVALGTCLISLLMFFAMTVLLYRSQHFKPYAFWRDWHLFSPAQLRATFQLGIPIAIAHAMEVGMFSAAAILIGWLGAEALAAHQVALQCATLTFMIPLGISQAVSVKVGERYGARKFEDILSVTKAGLVFSTTSAFVAGIVFWVFPEYLVKAFLPFNSGDSYETVLTIATSILVMAALFQLVDAWQVTVMGALRGFKLGASPTAISLVSCWLIGVPAAYFLLAEWGAAGVWGGLGLGLASCAVLLGLLFWRVFRKESAQFV